MRKAFTLIELLVVIAIIAILSVVIILTLNPVELLKQSRDSNRVSDMSTLNEGVSLALVNNLPLGNASTVYVSVPDTSPSCANLGLPALPGGWTYACATSSTYVQSNGTGWIPVNFGQITSGNPLPKLPIDPTNTTSSCLYYTYVTNGTTYELTTAAESAKQKAALAVASGTYSDVFGVGTNTSLLPVDYAAGCAGPTGPVYGLNSGSPVSVSGTATTTLTFAGTAGQIINIAATGVTYSCVASGILSPSSTVVVSGVAFGGGCGTSFSFNNVTLPTTGTYTFYINNGGANGAATVVLSPNITGGIVLSTPVAVSSSYAGQYINLTFAGTAGQVINFAGTGVTYSCVVAGINNASGTTVVRNVAVGGGCGTSFSFNNVTLSTNGNYSVYLNPGAASGVGTFIVAPNITGSLPFNTTTTISSALPGQYIALTFSGTSGQIITLTATGVSYSCVASGILTASGTTVASNIAVGGGCGNSYSFTSVTLPSTGTYTLYLNPGAAVGSATFRLN